MRPAVQGLPERERVTLSLNHEVVEFFRNCGQGWQNKLNDILQRYVKTWAQGIASLSPACRFVDIFHIGRSFFMRAQQKEET